MWWESYELNTICLKNKRDVTNVTYVFENVTRLPWFPQVMQVGFRQYHILLVVREPIKVYLALPVQKYMYITCRTVRQHPDS